MSPRSAASVKIRRRVLDAQVAGEDSTLPDSPALLVSPPYFAAKQ